MLELLNDLNAGNDIKRMLYEKAHGEKEYSTIKSLIQESFIRSDFRFLRDYLKEWIESDRPYLLALPYFNTDQEDFRGVVEKLTKKRFSKGILRIFWEKVKKYGVTFLNNYYELTPFMDDLGITHDELLSLDHSIILQRDLKLRLQGIMGVLKHYSHYRKMILLRAADESMRADIARMWDQFNLDNDPEVKEILPKKPRDLKTVHDKLSTHLRLRSIPDTHLNQDINFLHGLPAGEFIIDVPKTSHDLIRTSDELKHCVFSYENSVQKKQCQILNLLKGGAKVYTIELKGNLGDYIISQFKGIQNEKSMEGPDGSEMRSIILGWVNRKK